MIEKSDPFAVFDIESNDWVRLEALGFFDGGIYKAFFDVKSFLNFINRKAYNNYIIYSHNGGKFDHLFLIEEMYNRNWKVEIIERGGSVIILQVETSRGVRLTFSDSYALLPSSLKDLTIAFNVEHKKKDFDVTKGVSRHNKRLMKYLENDCIGLYEVITKFRESEFVVSPKFTIASQALDTFRQKFFDSEFVNMRITQEELIRREFYSGGRVELYKSSAEVYYYDVNSLYPFVMLNEMPTGSCKTVTRYQPGKIGFYKVHLASTPDWYISPLLIKRKKNYFVNGKGDYFLSSATLEMLRRDYGIRFRVEFGFVFSKREHIFNDYVETFYKLKREHKGDVIATIAKFFLNSLYGKFGQARFREVITMYKPGLQNFTMFDEHFGLVLVSKESRNKFILPYIASYITELARLHHFILMREREHDLVYCDTDSLLVTKPMPNRFIGEGIGKLKFEGKYQGVFLAPKCYALKNRSQEKVCFKGFDSKLYRFKDLARALRKGKSLTMTKVRMLSFRECIRRVNDIKDDAGRFLKTVTIEKEATFENANREMIPSKKFIFDSKPFDFIESGKTKKGN